MQKYKYLQESSLGEAAGGFATQIVQVSTSRSKSDDNEA